MKITDDKIDELFRSQLNEESQFHSAEDQWQVVSSRLRRGGTRKPLLWIFSGVVLLGLSFAFLPEALVPSHAKQIVTEISENQKESAELSTSASATVKISDETNTLVAPTEVTATEVTPSSLTRLSNTSSLPPAPIRNSNTLDGFTSHELCHCPADTLLTRTQSRAMLIQTPLLQSEAITAVALPTGADHKIAVLPEFQPLPLLAALDLIEEFGLEERLMPSALSDAVTKKPIKKNRRLSVATGIIKDFYGSSFVDSTALAPYFSIHYRFSRRFLISLGYNSSRTVRDFDSGFRDYQLIDSYFIPQQSIITQGSVRYREQVLDLGLAYQVYSLKVFSASVLGGLQIEKRMAGSLALEIENVYATDRQEFALPEEPIQLSKVYLGIGSRLSIINNLGLEFQLKRMIPVSTRLVNWGSHYRVSVGLNYNI